MSPPAFPMKTVLVTAAELVPVPLLMMPNPLLLAMTESLMVRNPLGTFERI